MATRFGASRPARTFIVKVRWLVGGLVSVVFILILALLFVVSHVDEQWSTSSTVAQASTLPPPVMADILISRQRVESGEALLEFMFDRLPVKSDRVPQGAILYQNRNTVLGKYAKELIHPGALVQNADLADVRPVNPLMIPEGFRAIAIGVDSRTSVEGFAKPKTRVDVLWTYKDRRETILTTIARFTKVLSFGGETNESKVGAHIRGQTTVTLLATEFDAQKIELAQNLGKLSLVLLGNHELNKISRQSPEVTIRDLIKRGPKSTTKHPAIAGVMYTTDAATGQQLKYILVNGRWTRSLDETETLS